MPPLRSDPLTLPVQFLKGVGPRKAELLKKLGIETALDLLYHFPREHIDWTRVTPVARAAPGTECVLRGRIVSSRFQYLRARLNRIVAVVDDGSGTFEAVWFNQPFLRERLAPGAEVAIAGRIQGAAGRPQVTPERGRFVITPGPKSQVPGPKSSVLHPPSSVPGPKTPVWGSASAGPGLKPAAAGDPGPGTGDFGQEGGLQPVYPETAGLTSRMIRPMVEAALAAVGGAAPDALPEGLRRERGFPPAAEALRQMHFPVSEAARAAARRRLVFEEAFVLQAALAVRRRSVARERVAFPLRIADPLDLRIRLRFPFDLTAAQERAARAIRADLQRPHPMNRLLHGDVGSGKTMVAAYALLAAIGNRRQAAIMAPTELLAEQHARTFGRLLAGTKVRIGHLAGGLPARERRDLLARIAAGEIDLVVGTHALIQSDVAFRHLALAVVDEQHKFGVLQRAALRAKGLRPHMLVMTATPIPRTLALTVFGDLDVSVLDELPPGRRPVRTLFRPPGREEDAYEFIRAKLREGRQAYFVYPRVEDAGDTPASGSRLPTAGEPIRAAKAMAKRLAAGPLAGFPLALLHGAMPAAEKDRVMEAFRKGDVRALVSTVIIEVGIDVPNAAIMVVDHAERFGLAQLHQLRGRVGRGAEESYCWLFGNPQTPEARARIDALTRTNDGFRIAEEDLRLRGPGEFFGTAQSGLPALKLLDLVREGETLTEARRAAFAVVARDPRLAMPVNAGLRATLRARFRSRLGLAEVG